MAKKQKQEQSNLFGEVDLVFNCLHTELTIVSEEIGSAHKRISSLKEKIGTLETRKTEIEKAIKIVKPMTDEKKAPSDFPPEEQGDGDEPEAAADAEEEESEESETGDIEEEDEEVDVTEEVEEEIEESFLDKSGKNNVIKCSNCRSLILKNATFCPGCGHEV